MDSLRPLWKAFHNAHNRPFMRQDIHAEDGRSQGGAAIARGRRRGDGTSSAVHCGQEGEDFYTALLRIWLSAKPFEDSQKKGLLGG